MFTLIVKEIKPVLFAVYNVTVSAYKLRKPDYVAYHMEGMEKNIRKYEIYLPLTSQGAENSNIAEIPM